VVAVLATEVIGESPCEYIALVVIKSSLIVTVLTC